MDFMETLNLFDLKLSPQQARKLAWTLANCIDKSNLDVEGGLLLNYVVEELERIGNEY